MKKLLSPYWIILITIIPILIFCFICWGEYRIIHTLLNEDEIKQWNIFYITISALLTCSLIYSIRQIVKKKRISLIYSISSLAIYTIYLVIFYMNFSDLIPINIPQWMVSGNIGIYGSTFIMPTLLHSMLCTIIRLTPNENNSRLSTNFLIMLLIPALFYLFIILVSPLWRNSNSNIGEDIIPILFANLCVIFMFFFLRFFYILVRRRNINLEDSIIAKTIFTFLFPFIGLTLNAAMGNIFGDFTNIWFFVIAFMTGIVIIIPASDKPTIRLILLLIKSITYCYTIYFCLVFMPLIPLALVGIIIMGLGLLMLTPLILFIYHTNDLIKDTRFIKKHYKGWKVNLAIIASLLVIPIGITLSYKSDKVELTKMMDYIYSPNLANNDPININSISKTLEATKPHSRTGFLYQSTPFLSSYFKWIVMDNLNISNNRRKTIEDIIDEGYYYPKSEKTTRQNDPLARESTAELKNIECHSRYDSINNIWISQVDIILENPSAKSWNVEYSTQFELPVGCWISNYYLYVGDRKEMGILAEKKAATWIFKQIRDYRQDPGLLRYIGGNTIDFRVFPFSTKEIRQTGIEFTHKEPITLEFDGRTILLGNNGTNNLISDISKSEDVIYLSAQDKEKLETVVRKPYYHFIIDTSADRSHPYRYQRDSIEIHDIENRKTNYINDIEHLLSQNQTEFKSAKISYVNAFTETVELKEGWKQDLHTKIFKNGFFLDRAIRKILFDHYTNPSDNYPIIVILSDNIYDAIILDGLADWKFTYPEKQCFYLLKNKEITSFALFSNSIKKTEDTLSLNTKKWVSDKATIYLPDDGKPSIVLNTKSKTIETTDKIAEKQWNSALLMQGQWMLQTLYPETSNKEWINLVKNSFRSQIMTPLTSFIVVENEAQKAVLAQKQRQTLEGNKNLDLEDPETIAMSEPDMFIIIALLLIIVFFYKWKKNKNKNKQVIKP